MIHCMQNLDKFNDVLCNLSIIFELIANIDKFMLVSSFAVTGGNSGEGGNGVVTVVTVVTVVMVAVIVALVI